MAVTSKPCSVPAVPAEVSQAEPGSVHDITAARLHALYRAAAGDLPTLADPGYEGIGILIPVRQPAGGGTGYQYPHSQRHPALAALPRERGSALLTGR